MTKHCKCKTIHNDHERNSSVALAIILNLLGLLFIDGKLVKRRPVLYWIDNDFIYAILSCWYFIIVGITWNFVAIPHKMHRFDLLKTGIKR